MANTALWILGLYVASLLIFALGLLRAPHGYEDRQGFHFGLIPKRVMFARRRPARK